jgi:hypothetical protein
MWDELIELFTRHYMAGTSHHLSEVESAHYDFERVLRFFARENRTRRRLLANAIRDMHRTTPPDRRRLGCRLDFTGPKRFVSVPIFLSKKSDELSGSLELTGVD